MSTITPIKEDQQQQVKDAVGRWLTIAEQLFERQFLPIPVRFDLRGKTAGMYRVRGDERVIRFNPWIFAKYPEDSFANTIPHEVAHYVADCCYGLRRIKPHGAEWKSIMQLFGADSRATSRYSLEGIPQRRMTRFAYHCACKIHELSSQRHHRIRRGVAEYRCRSCGSLLMGQAST